MFDSLKSCLNIVSVANSPCTVIQIRWQLYDSFSVLDITLVIITFETSQCDSNISIKYWLEHSKQPILANSDNYMTLYAHEICVIKFSNIYN